MAVFQGNVLKWSESYTQQVMTGNYTSATSPVTCRVPEGFNIGMKPLDRPVRQHGLKCHQYADETQIYLFFTINYQLR